MRNDTELRALQSSVDALTAQVTVLVERQRVLDDLVAEAGPILRAMTDTGIDKLGAMERQGWFAFGAELVRVLERVVEHYQPDDVAALGDHVIDILDTVRNVTQPQVLEVANHATDALTGGGKPVGMFGLVKATRDEEVQRGMAVALEVLRHLGRSPGGHRPARDARPVRDVRHGTAARPQAPKAQTTAARVEAAACAATPSPGAPAHDFGGYAIDAQGFLCDPASWTREFAAGMATALGVELTDAHWTLIDFARNEYLTQNASPNIRRITTGAGIETRAVYQLFPKAPGKTISRIAGIPKPAGCI